MLNSGQRELITGWHRQNANFGYVDLINESNGYSMYHEDCTHNMTFPVRTAKILVKLCTYLLASYPSLQLIY